MNYDDIVVYQSYKGGRRCRYHRLLRAVSLESLFPETPAGVPEIVWTDHGNPPPTPAQLYERYDQLLAGATVDSLRWLRIAEPVATRALQQAVPDGCRLHGLEHRIKSPQSLVAEIARKSDADPGFSAYDVRVPDLLRYTAVAASSDRVVAMTRETIRELRGHGWGLVEMESSFVHGNPRMDLRAILQNHQNGQEIEVQFHSEQSIEVKDAWHSQYGVVRDGDRPRSERSEVYQAMVEAWQSVEAPAGLDDLRSSGMPVKTRTFSNRYATTSQGANLYLMADQGRHRWIAHEDHAKGQLFVWVLQTGRFHRNQAVEADFYWDQNYHYQPIDTAEARKLMKQKLGKLDGRKKFEQLAQVRQDQQALDPAAVLGHDVEAESSS